MKSRLHLAVIEEIDGLALEDRLGEEPWRHVRPAPGTVDGEEAQARHRQAVEMGVAIGHELVRLLGRGIERLRMIDRIAFRKRQLDVAAIDRGGAGEDQMLQPLQMAAGFEHLELRDQIGRDIGAGVFERITHPRLRRQMDDPVDALGLLQQGFELALAGEIEAMEAEALLAREFLEPRLVSAPANSNRSDCRRRSRFRRAAAARPRRGSR